jgi:hypothetical protein
MSERIRRPNRAEPVEEGITVVDVIRELKLHPSNELCWEAGAKVREFYISRYNKLPEKALRTKTSGPGSHMFAVYPPSMRNDIIRIIRECVSETEHSDHSPAIAQKLKLIAAIADRHAMTPQYRALALAPHDGRTAVWVYAPFAALRCIVDLEIEEEVRVDANDFMLILKGLAPTKFTVAVKNNALHWRCGPSHGHLPLLDPTIDLPTPVYNDEKLELLGSEFGERLRLGALAAGTARQAIGVQIENHDGSAYAYASDSATISMCRLGGPLPTTEPLTLKPEAAAILADLARKQKPVLVACNPNSVYCLADDLQLQLNQLPPLDYRLADKIRPYLKHEITMPLYHEAVIGFIRRAEGLAEARQQTEVEIRIEAGKVCFAFREAAGSIEEHYVAEGGPKITMPPIRIAARRLTRALRDATQLVFDHADKSVLVLRDGAKDFVFGISGRPQ